MLPTMHYVILPPSSQQSRMNNNNGASQQHQHLHQPQQQNSLQAGQHPQQLQHPTPPHAPSVTAWHGHGTHQRAFYTMTSIKSKSSTSNNFHCNDSISKHGTSVSTAVSSGAAQPTMPPPQAPLQPSTQSPMNPPSQVASSSESSMHSINSASSSQTSLNQINYGGNSARSGANCGNSYCSKKGSDTHPNSRNMNSMNNPSTTSNSISNSNSRSNPSLSQQPSRKSSSGGQSSSSAALQRNYEAVASSLPSSSRVNQARPVSSNHNHGGGLPGFHGIGSGFTRSRSNNTPTTTSTNSDVANRSSHNPLDFSDMTSSSSFRPNQIASTAQNQNHTQQSQSSNQNYTNIVFPTYRHSNTPIAASTNQNHPQSLPQSQIQPNQLQHQSHYSSIAGLPSTLGPINLNIPAGGTVPEFLYQLTKMLTDTQNSPIIEWSPLNNGRIEVHNPTRLAAEVLHKYFRHSKYSSFQRQLNYFGFRKIAGKGKMSPCSYVNDAATSDIRSLLLIKRKTSEKERLRLEKLQLQRLEKRGAAGASASGSAGGGEAASKTIDGSAAGADAVSRGTGENKNGKQQSVQGEDKDKIAGRKNQETKGSALSLPALSSTPSTGQSDTCNAVTPLSPGNANTNNCPVTVNNPILSADSKNTYSYNQNITSFDNSNNAKSNKRMKTEQNQIRTGTPGITNAKFTVAIGKGVRHPWNGYLRDTTPNMSNINNNNNTNNKQKRPVPVNPAIARTLSMPASALPLPAPMPAMYNNSVYASRNISNPTQHMPTNSSQTTINNENNYLHIKNNPGSNKYLSHPSSNHATMAPAPLQFLDPSELGMSIESSLNQLKNNFRNATKSYADSEPSSAPSSGNGTSKTPEPASNPANTASSNSNHPSSAMTSSNANIATATSNTNNEDVVDPLNELESPSNDPSSATASINNMSSNNNDMKKVISINSFAGGFLSHNSSLIDLAMLPTLDNFDMDMGLSSIDDANFGSAADGTGNAASADGDAKARRSSSGAGTVGGTHGLLEEEDEDGTFNFIDFPNGDQGTGYADIL